MAHIAELLAGPSDMVGLNNYIARELSPPRTAEPTLEIPLAEEKGKERQIWRTHQPTESRRYQLFPAKDKLSITPGRNSPDPEQAFALAMGQSSNSTDRPILSSVMRLKSKDQSLIRRRKASVSDLGPMTTVQEVAMDSPTIPGRPPLHERSISAPGNDSFRQNCCGESIMAGPVIERGNRKKSPQKPPTPCRGRSISPTIISPKTLPPLVIPENTGSAPRVVMKQLSHGRLDSSDDIPPAVPPKSARILGLSDDRSPQSRTPYTPLTSSTNLSLLNSATPVSASEGRASPLPTSITNRAPSPMGHSRGQSETSTSTASNLGHRRERSETSIMDRGRPTKRADGNPTIVKRTGARPCHVVDQKAFELLPQGFKAFEAPSVLDRLEINALKQQAIGQAVRFEVLGMKDVEALSRELRALDERCDYLRKTHHSLRYGRRNLHERICTYLRSPRTAQFSHTSLLKQEEALVELDLSIDDWVNKLEQAENRRTRVRQKLLEHVAAALTLQSPAEDGLRRSVSRSLSVGENTPPRSPTKESMTASPEQLAQSVNPAASHQEGMDHVRMSKESIRIYADSDVYALLADVEKEINRIGMESAQSYESEYELLSAVSFSGSHRNRTPSPTVWSAV